MPKAPLARIVDAAQARILVALGVRLERLSDAISAAALPRFATAATGLVIQRPYEIRHPERIHLGRDVKLGPNCVLKPTTSYPGGWLRHPEGDHRVQQFAPELHIGDRVTATGGLQIAAFERVVIEDDVMFAANVFVADGTHGSDRGDLPYKFQGIGRVAPVRIGRGAWIGQNVVISPGVTIGAQAIVGANAVVTSDVPEGCVAAGTPARVIRRWDATGGRWQPVASIPPRHDEELA